jgi:hypothetical protein
VVIDVSHLLVIDVIEVIDVSNLMFIQVINVIDVCHLMFSGRLDVDMRRRKGNQSIGKFIDHL